MTKIIFWMHWWHFKNRSKTVNPSIMRFQFLINATHHVHKLICKDVIEGNAILWRSYIWPKFATSVDILQFINPLIICKKSGVKTLFELLDIFSNNWNKTFFLYFHSLIFHNISSKIFPKIKNQNLSFHPISNPFFGTLILRYLVKTFLYTLSCWRK